MEYDEYVLIQMKRQDDDIAKWPKEDHGVYRTIPWKMLRPNNSYWCGYIALRPSINNNSRNDNEIIKFAKIHEFISDRDNLDALASKTHYGFTGGDGIYSGFDCAHGDDFSYQKFILPNGETYIHGVCLDENSTYKDHEYVQTRIFDMIDFLADNLDLDISDSESQQTDESISDSDSDNENDE